MHNNYYFLRQLSTVLEKVITGTVISECFSQNKDELIIRFETHNGSYYIKATVQPNFGSISFPENFQRARKNSVDLFEKAIGRRVSNIRQFNNERSFAIGLSDSFSILFKMHGNRANIILFEGDMVTDLFRNNIEGDSTLILSALDRDIDWRYEPFEKQQDKLQSLYFTFGKMVWRFLELNDFNAKSPQQKWEQIQEVRTHLENPSFYITQIDSTLKLSLLNMGVVVKTLNDPIAAANDFYYTFTQVFALHQQKDTLLSALKAKLQSSRNFHKKNADKLEELKHNNNFKEWADLIMANLHAIKQNTEKVTLQNFYNENLPVEIKLKRELSPQKNAEVYYRKSKNQQIETDRLLQVLTAKETEIGKLEAKIASLETSGDLKEIKKAQSELTNDPEAKKKTAPLPYHEFVVNGFRIWVGRNAESNDVLTLKLGYKEDLWLHAKDVAGSHVLIKHQSGKNFPKDVIERAAQLAAYNSKRKNETLCPVVVTPKKYVRKRKGDPAGAVVVEREEVIMVEPRL